MADATPLIIPQLGALYQALLPWAEALLRLVGGSSSDRMGIVRSAEHPWGLDPHVAT
ncbi:MAG: hypothetical protein IT537_11330 [Hyphomicrobiales bacterium]|nr:hypothetical protein [Hyphomicrobiales bacterium]